MIPQSRTSRAALEAFGGTPLLALVEIAATRYASSPRTLELYSHYWSTAAASLGDVELHDIRPVHIQRLANEARENAVRRSSSIDGRSAAEHMISAMRALFKAAVDDELMWANPALPVKKPPRAPAKRRVLTDAEVSAMFDAVTDDDTAVLRFLFETGARRAGVVGLTPQDVRHRDRTVMVLEKGTKPRRLPVTSAMSTALLDPACPVYHMTPRRFDGLFGRIRRELDWAADDRVSAHWCRHWAITQMERHGSYAVAAEFAGHTLREATGTYVHITLSDIATVFSRVHGETHPLAR